ncbi:MAG: hypothetical protein M1813_002834 [Trichoglossum hirsutum]|nr:MAG: hypothetical protein M1813_002834 [Trichoglossum hirsutum]
MPLVPRSSYYDNHYRQSAALLRARRPYLIKNAVTGLVIFSFAVGVYAFTIKAVSQDDFEDVIIPDTPQSSKAHNTTTTAGASR